MHAEAVDALPQPLVGEVHEAPARDVVPWTSVIRAAPAVTSSSTPSRSQHGDPGRLQEQPGAHRPGARRAFEHLARVARACQQRRRGEPRGPRPDDPDLTQEPLISPENLS